MKTIQVHPSDNETQVIGFEPAHVRSFESKEAFVSASTEAGHFAGHAEQTELLGKVWDKAQPAKEAPVVKTNEDFAPGGKTTKPVKPTNN